MAARGGNGGKILAAAGLAGGAYYLYTAGGSPKVAEKQMERE